MTSRACSWWWRSSRGPTRWTSRTAWDQALDELRPGLRGIQMDNHIFRPAGFIELSIHNLRDALLLGTLLVVLVLIAFLFQWRAALISLVAIPLSLMAAAMVLYLRGSTINTMVLAGFVIAVGVVVDDAIIDIENIVRRLRQARAAGDQTVGIVGDPGGLARGQTRDRLCDLDHRARSAPRLLHHQPLRGVLQAAGALIRPGGARVDGGRSHRHPRARLAAAGQGAPGRASAAAGARAPALVHEDPCPPDSKARPRPSRPR